MATWPLSNYVLVDGFSESPPNNSLRSKMGEGPPKTRRKSISGVRPIVIQKHLYKSDVEILDIFHETTLVNGTLAFDWISPRTGSVVEMMFVEPPVYESLGGTAWSVSMKLEIQP